MTLRTASSTALVLALSLFTGLCAAQDSLRGLYVGGGLGSARATNFCSEAALGGGVAGCDQRANTWQVFGGYQFNNHLSLQAGYHDLGKASVPGGTEMRFTAFEVAGVAGVPMGGVTLYGKAGWFRGETEGFGRFANLNQHHGALTIGAGVQWDFSRMFGLRGEWQRFPNMGGGVFGGSVDVNVLSVGALMRF